MSDRTIDRRPRYTPAVVMTLNGVQRVTSAYAYPPNAHPPQSPILARFTAVELRTCHGSRWYGVERAWINSHLRMVISGFDVRNEEMRKWPRAPREGRPNETGTNRR